MGPLRPALFIATALLLCLLVPPAHAAPGDILIPLDDEGFDMEYDAARDRLYVSIPNRNEIVVISGSTSQVVNRIRLDTAALRRALGDSVSDVVVGTRPHGIDISLDGSLLFVALNETSAVAYVDLETLAVSQVVIGAELGDSRTWDVIEGKPNRVFASANPSSSGFAYIAMIKRDEGNAASRVAGERIIRARPTFAASPDGQFLYVGEGFSPNSLYKLDLSSDAAPIVLEDVHGSVSGTDQLGVSPDGGLIYLGSGQVLQTSDFVQIGLVDSGVPRVSADGSQVYVAKLPGSVEVFETDFFTKLDTVDLPCALNNLRAFSLVNDGEGFLVLGDNVVCGRNTTIVPRPRCEVLPSFDADTLTLGFELGTPTPATWNLWVSVGSTVTRLWRVPVPVVDPPVTFEHSTSGLPPLGTIGFLSTLVTGEGIVCSDWELVETGIPVVAVPGGSVRELLLPPR